MICDNIKILEEQISQKCIECGRTRSDIKVVAVSKTQPISKIEEAFNCGIKNFGENKAQEFRDKTQNISEQINWHFIGHLQSNKIKYVVGKADFIHSVNSIKLADEISQRAEKLGVVQKVLIEMNTSGEETKIGLENENRLLKIIEFCNENKSIELKGLMTMAPYTDDENIIRQCFVKLRETKEKLNGLGFELNDLSMGMTNDFEIGIEEGATILRIGTAIFGERNYLN